MAPILRSILLLTTFLSFATAVPTEGTPPFHTPVLSHSSTIHRPKPASGPLTTLRNIIIERIWGAPHRVHSVPCHRDSQNAPTNFRTRYGGDVVLRFKFSTSEEIEALAEASDMLYLDVWESTDEWVDIRIAKDVVPSFLGLLPKSLQQSHTLLMHDLAQAVYETYPSSSDSDLSPQSSFTSSLYRHAPDGEGRELFFQEYQPLAVIHPWMKLMTSLFPSHVRLTTIGISNEGRDIAALVVGVRPTNDEEDPKPRDTILVSGGSHAREWISVSTVNYMAYSLITRYGKYKGVTKLLEHFDIVFIPTFNPDGYVYSWDHDRLWRKNRQATPITFCPGIDLDRAFGYKWDGDKTKDNPCSESYAGDGPFSGTEARVLADWARNETKKNDVNVVAFLDLHSYSQQILYPYSYSCRKSPPSLEDLEEVAMGLAKGIRLANGHHYGVSSACEGSTAAATSGNTAGQAKILQGGGGGSALDWFYSELGTKHTYQIKLRDTGSYGFLLPKQNIVPTGQEAYNAFMNLGHYLLGNKGVELNELGIDWDDEYIISAQRDTVGEPKQEQAQSVDAIDDVSEQDEEDYDLDLRRRRRR